MKYRPDIDGLRAVAVLPVILFHAGFGFFSGGFIGVDVFFVISGYLITSILVNDIEKGQFSIVNFYERRARRILPALFLVISICALFAWKWMLPNQMKDFSQSLVAVSLFASNVLFWLESGYFAAASEQKPLLHTWSLAVEEQYYLFFPLFLLFAWRFGKSQVFWIIVVLTICSLALSEWAWRNEASANFYLAPMRAWELFIGSIAVFIEKGSRSVKPNNALSLCGLLAVFFAIFAYDENTPIPSLYALVPTLGVLLIILFSDEETLVAKILSSKLLVGIGLISYSAYLWHQPIFAMARIRLFVEPTVALKLALCIFSLVLAFISWKFVEQPFRRAAFISRKGIFIFSAFGLFIVSLFGFWGTWSEGFPALRFPNAPQLASIYPPAEQRVASEVRSDNGRTCYLLGLDLLEEEVCATNSLEPKYLIAGNSKAMAFYSAFHADLIDEPAMLIAAHSCPTYPNLTYTPTHQRDWGNNCTAISKKIVEVSASIESIETVVIVVHAVDVSDNESRYFVEGNPLTNREAFRLGFGFLIDELAKLGLNVVFVTDVPDLERDPFWCIYNSSGTEFSSSCSPTEATVRAAYSDYYSEVQRIKELHQVKVYDSTDFFCRNVLCQFYADGRLLYFDRTHLAPYGASLLIKQMVSDGVLR